MSSPNNYALIMAGGSGSRLWPMSRIAQPKQFQQLLGRETPFQLMIRLIQEVVPIERIFVMGIPAFRETILAQAPNLPAKNILIEPALRDTGPAIALGMLQIAQRDPEAIVATLWSDHLILHEEVFGNVLRGAFAAANEQPDRLVMVGAKAMVPDPALGYIHFGKQIGEYDGIPLHQVQKFVEKPTPERAEEFVTSGEYFWNVGYNVIGVQAFLSQLRKHQPDLVSLLAILERCLTIRPPALDTLAVTYEQFPKISIDFLLIQKLSDIAVVAADMGWSDIGTWTTLHKMLVEKTGQSLVTQGPVHAVNSHDSLVFAKDRPIAILNIDNIVVVDSGDVILVMRRDAPASDLKKLVQETLSTTNPNLL